MPHADGSVSTSSAFRRRTSESPILAESRRGARSPPPLWLRVRVHISPGSPELLWRTSSVDGRSRMPLRTPQAAPVKSFLIGQASRQSVNTPSEWRTGFESRCYPAREGCKANAQASCALVAEQDRAAFTSRNMQGQNLPRVPYIEVVAQRERVCIAYRRRRFDSDQRHQLTGSVP